MSVLIPISRGQFAIVDESDAEWLSRHKWFAQPSNSSYGGFYVCRNVPGQRGGCIRMHREILAAPANMTVDHINRNGLDNRRENLRLATHAQQMSNRKFRNGSYPEIMGLRGVTRGYGKAGRWRSQIVFGDSRKLGPTRLHPLQSAFDYDKEALAKFGEFATLNFPCRSHGPMTVAPLHDKSKDRRQLSEAAETEIKARYTGAYGEVAHLAAEYGVSRDVIYAALKRIAA